MLRAATFTLTGLLWLGYSVVASTGANYLEPERLIDFVAIYGFSAALFALAVALPLLGQLGRRRWVLLAGRLGGLAAATAAIVNVFEDGLNIEWMFLPFVASSLAMAFALLAMTGGFAVFGRGAERLLAIVPLSALLGFQGLLGGVVALVAWLGAAVVVARRRREPAAG